MRNKKKENGLRRQIAQICVAVGFALLAGCASVTYSSPHALSGITIKGAAGAPSQLVFVKRKCFFHRLTCYTCITQNRIPAGEDL